MEKVQKAIRDEFRDAVNRLDHKKLKELLPVSKDYINIRFYFHWAQDGYGDEMTPLMYVCGMFAYDSYSLSHYACYSPAALCFKLLIEHGADPNIPSDEGYTPIFSLIHELNLNFTDGIFSNFNILEKLVNAGANINFMSIKKKSETPLIATCRLLFEDNNGHGNYQLNNDMSYSLIRIINYLIPHGLDLNLRDKEGRTALYYASKLGSKDLLLCLLTAGADY